MTQLEKLKAEEAELEAAMAANLGNPTEQPVEAPQPTEPVATTPTIDEQMTEIITQTDGTQEPYVQEEPEPPPKQRTNWKKRYTNYKASTDATIYGLRSEVSELKAQLAEALQSINTMRDAKVENQGDVWEGTFSEDDVATFGADGLEVVKKAASTLVERQLDPLKQRIQEQESKQIDQLKRSAEADQKRAYDEFITRLGTLVPDYAEINVDREFLEWMKLPDDYSGITRADLFRKAESVRDVARVAEFFVEFQQSKQPKDDPLPREVQQHIMPTGSGSASTVPSQTNNSGVQYIYISEINKFYDDVGKGRYVGRESDIANIEAQIERAHVEGRILQG